MTITMHRSSEITVGLPREPAMALFTPEGERRWADGWDPHYPAPSRREGPGTVFTTGHAGHDATWVMVDQGSDCVRYARIVHGMTAGTVAVEVVGNCEDATRVRVTYDLTALTPAGETWLEAYNADYDTAIAGWSSEIAAALGAARDDRTVA
jgi:hypothetical protein